MHDAELRNCEKEKGERRRSPGNEKLLALAEDRNTLDSVLRSPDQALNVRTMRVDNQKRNSNTEPNQRVVALNVNHEEVLAQEHGNRKCRRCR